MKTFLRLFFCVCAAMLASGAIVPVSAATLTANGTVFGSLFNTASRQHIQASFRGNGVVNPGGHTGSANGRVTSVIGERTPRPSLLGLYRVLAQAHVRYDGNSTSVSKEVTLDVRRRSISVRGIGKVRLNRSINPRRTGRQRINGTIAFTIRGI